MRDPKDVDAGMEAMLLRQLLTETHAFKVGGSGGHVAEDMFTSTLADVLARQHVLHLNVGKQGGAHNAFETQSLAATGAHGDDVKALAQRIVGEHAHVTSAYGARIDPITHEHDFHHGLDIAAPLGTPITAVKAGVVRSAEERGGYGLVVEIDHGDGLLTRYAHASALCVKAGDVVRPGDVVARVGSTGRSTGPHVHVEAQVRGRPTDPTLALQNGALRSDSLLRGSAP